MRIVIAIAGISVCLFGSTGLAQNGFRDDAGRTVTLPSNPRRLFAAGGPAEVLLHTLAPHLLVGRNRMPTEQMLGFFPPAYQPAIPIRQLPEVDNPAADAELVELAPQVYIDYGTVDADYVASVEAVQKRTGVPGIILDGALSQVPDTYRRLGDALGVQKRGQELSAASRRLLDKYRGVLRSPSGPLRVYLACSSDASVPCLSDQPAGEQLEWLGGVNVASTQASAPRRALTPTEIRALRPQVIIVNSDAARMRSDPAWQTVDSVRSGRVYEWPSLPYSWGPRPPSVNRLPGLVWLAYVARGEDLNEEFRRDIHSFFSNFYQVTLTDAQFRTLGVAKLTPGAAAHLTDLPATAERR